MTTVLIAIAAFVVGVVAGRLIGRRAGPVVETMTAGGAPSSAEPQPRGPVPPEIAAIEPQAEPASESEAVAAQPKAEAVSPGVGPAFQPASRSHDGMTVRHEAAKRKPRETTVLVCGVGSSTPGDEVPANVLRCLTDLQRILAGIIGDEGGSIDRFAGDRVIAVFRAKGRRTDHAGHALEAAQRITSNVGAVSRRLGYDLRIGVGVHSGSLPVGDNGRVDETAIGDAIDVAARLESLAGKAKVGVIVSEDVLERAEESASGFEAIGEMMLPGDSAAHRVFAPKSRDGVVQLDLIDLRAAATSIDHPPVAH